jgi:peptide/nickel transport system ATP-binding protein
MTASEDAPLLSVEGLRTYYEDDSILWSAPPVRAVDDVTFDIREGETLGLVGESGCGKTTLGRTILGLETATGGTVASEGRDVTELSRSERREWQRRVGMVFQDPRESLNDRMTTGEIIREPLDAHGWPFLTAAVEGGDMEVRGSDISPADGEESPDITVRVTGDGPEVSVREALPLEAADVSATIDGSTVTVSVERSKGEIQRGRVFDLLEQVGLSEEHFYRYPHQFSGGQRQRIGIARALALEPDFLVLDEPVSALDVSVQARIINLLEDLQESLGLTYLFIAHDLSVVRHIADQVAVMYLGNIVERGPTEEVYTNPKHPYTVALLSAIPGSGSPWEGERVTLRGSPPSPRDPPSGCPFATRCPAKIRPDGWDLPEETWRALDELRMVFRTRARTERSLPEILKQAVGMEVAGEELSAIVDDLLEGLEYGPETEAIVDEAVDLAREGRDREAADRLKEAFGSRCDEERPSVYRHGDGESRCLRHETGYDGVEETVAARERGEE